MRGLFTIKEGVLWEVTDSYSVKSVLGLFEDRIYVTEI